MLIGGALRLVVLSSLVTLVLVVANQSAAQTTAAEALQKCDALASDPHDPDRDAVGVTDDQFVPRRAIDACEAAVELNPDLPRARFELGRAYWNARKDKDAFRAFFEATKRNYAPAMKYIGDAYLEGRGLPTGESQSTNTAMVWYKRSADGGYVDGTLAFKETRDAIARQKRAADDARIKAAREAEDAQVKAAREADDAKAKAVKEQFDPSAFQNQTLISAIYYNRKSEMKGPAFLAYATSFLSALREDTTLFFDPDCKGLVPASVFNEASLASGLNAMGTLFQPMKMPNAANQGNADAFTVVNRYKCGSPVGRMLITNLSARISSMQSPFD